jgi:WD40 repeat protein
MLLLGGVTAAIVVIIRDKQGNKIAEIDVPEGGSVEIKDISKGKAEAKRQRTRPGNTITAEPLPPLLPGEPLSPIALVQQPATLPGVRSWSLAAREAFPAAIAYRPDGKRLAVGGADGLVRIWELPSGRLVQVLLTPGGVAALAWSPDGRVLATGATGTPLLELWDADSGRRLRALDTQGWSEIAIAWSADGRKVRSWRTTGNCCTWEAAEGKLVQTLMIPCQRPAFSPDGQRLAGVVDGRRIRIWDADTAKEVSERTAPAMVWGLAWAPDNNRLAWAGKDGLHIWDVKNRKETFHNNPTAFDVAPPAWSPDGRSIAYITGNRSVETLEFSPGAKPLSLEDLTGTFNAWSPDGKTIARGSAWLGIKLYDAATGKRRLSLSEGTSLEGFAWSPDQRTFAISEWNRTILISADNGHKHAELTGSVWPLSWSPDGKRLASAGTNNEVWLSQPDGKERIALTGYTGVARSLAWSLDGKRLASTAAGEKRVLLWNTDNGERQRELGPFAGETNQAKWSADGRLLAFNVAGVGWHVWDVDKNRLVNDPEQWNVHWFDLSPDGRSALVAPSATEEYRLRELASGKDGARLPRSPEHYLDHPRWSPDRRVLAVPVWFGMELWRADLSKRLRTLLRSGGPSQVRFSSDGKLVAGHSGERLLLWESDSGRLRGIVLLGQRHNGLTIAPDGRYTGNDQVERSIVVDVQKADGTQEVLEPADFEQKYGWKNEPVKVHLLQPLPPTP